MKSAVILLLFNFFFFTSFSQIKEVHSDKPDSTKKIQMAEASCGQCGFHLPGKGCDLAVRIKDKAYFVDGTDIDSHGDAHAKDGFCKSIRQAEVQGEIVNNRFKATYFALIKPETKKD